MHLPPLDVPLVAAFLGTVVTWSERKFWKQCVWTVGIVIAIDILILLHGGRP